MWRGGAPGGIRTPDTRFRSSRARFYHRLQKPILVQFHACNTMLTPLCHAGLDIYRLVRIGTNKTKNWCTNWCTNTK